MRNIPCSEIATGLGSSVGVVRIEDDGADVLRAKEVAELRLVERLVVGPFGPAHEELQEGQIVRTEKERRAAPPDQNILNYTENI